MQFFGIGNINATLSKLYLTDTGIIMTSLKSIGQLKKNLTTITNIRNEQTDPNCRKALIHKQG